jgi:hypothetical protein
MLNPGSALGESFEERTPALAPRLRKALSVEDRVGCVGDLWGRGARAKENEEVGEESRRFAVLGRLGATAMWSFNPGFRVRGPDGRSETMVVRCSRDSGASAKENPI